MLGKAHIHMILVTICQLGSVACDVAYKIYCHTIAIAQILLILSQMPQNMRGMSDHLHGSGCKDKSNSSFLRPLHLKILKLRHGHQQEHKVGNDIVEAVDVYDIVILRLANSFGAEVLYKIELR